MIRTYPNMSQPSFIPHQPTTAVACQARQREAQQSQELHEARRRLEQLLGTGGAGPAVEQWGAAGASRKGRVAACGWFNMAETGG